MPDFGHLKTDLSLTADIAKEDPLVQAGHSLNREAQMLLSGIGGAALDTVTHPIDKLPELGLSLGTGAALGAMSRLGASGRVIAGGVAGAMMLKFAYDEYNGNRWSNFGSALKDNWLSADNLDRNTEITRNSLGSFLVDSGIAWAGMALGSFATARYAPPSILLKDAFKRANTDGGAAIVSLQNRFENPSLFQSNVDGKLELAAHSWPAVAGEPRGDLIKVASTPDGKILLTAMDVQGHGLNAGKKSAQLHSIIDSVIPETSNMQANDILSKIDSKLSVNNELNVTAGLMTYDPLTHELQTATASGELAYLIKADGAVQRLDAKVGGMSLGLDWYKDTPRGNEVIHLGKGDTVIMASDGVFDRFAGGNWGGLPESTLSLRGFKTFLERMGPDPQAISDGILNSLPPKTGVDDASFVVFRRPK